MCLIAFRSQVTLSVSRPLYRYVIRQGTGYNPVTRNLGGYLKPIVQARVPA
jgi:hypothetical protein